MSLKGEERKRTEDVEKRKDESWSKESWRRRRTEPNRTQLLTEPLMEM